MPVLKRGEGARGVGHPKAGFFAVTSPADWRLHDEQVLLNIFIGIHSIFVVPPSFGNSSVVFIRAIFSCENVPPTEDLRNEKGNTRS